MNLKEMMFGRQADEENCHDHRRRHCRSSSHWSEHFPFRGRVAFEEESDYATSKKKASEVVLEPPTAKKAKVGLKTVEESLVDAEPVTIILEVLGQQMMIAD